MSTLSVFMQGDAATQLVALLLLAMSVASWVVIFWKSWLLRRAGGDIALGIAAFWQAESLQAGRSRIAALDREALLQPLMDAIEPQSDSSLAGSGQPVQRLTRLLREALFEVQSRLRHGQVLLATVGSTAPFVGLLGTVWGIYHALVAIASAGQITIERIAAPVGEALIMTAAGLAVAIPAVLAYNVFGRKLSDIELRLDGFAHDLCALATTQADLPQAADSKAEQGR